MSRWQAGRGRLGFLEPLLGAWVAGGEAPLGPYRCERTFARVLGGAWVQLAATWEMGGRRYEELALFGVDDGAVRCWSFTSDRKHAVGWRAESVEGLPEGAIAFEFDMPAGRARQAYWPADDGDGVIWVVESRVKAGWNRFTEHRYRRLLVPDRPATDAGTG